MFSVKSPEKSSQPFHSVRVDRVNRDNASRTSDPYSAGPVPLISAVIVNYNSWPDVVSLVARLAGSAEVASGLCEVVVVDNASDGSPPDSMLRPRPGVRLVARPENGGFAVGVNSGWRISRGSWLLLINPDVVVTEGWLGRIVARVRHHEAANDGAPGVVGFALRNPDDTAQPSVGTFPSLGRAVWEQLIPRSRRKYQAVWRTNAGPVDWVTGACMLVNSRMLEVLGGLDEEFFLYYEEVALCRSAVRLGWKVEYDPDPDVAVVHLRPLQTRTLSPGMRVITRHSKLLYFRKHLPRWQFLALCMVVATESRLRRGWARIRGRTEEFRAWRVICGVVEVLRSGAALGGLAVLDLAAAVAEPDPSTQPDPSMASLAATKLRDKRDGGSDGRRPE